MVVFNLFLLFHYFVTKASSHKCAILVLEYLNHLERAIVFMSVESSRRF